MFSELYVGLVQAGEASGQLGKVLERLADELETAEERRSKIRSALSYPILLIVAGFSAVLFILIFALGLGLFPTTAQPPDGASIFTQLKYLLLPSLCLVCTLFGYIARMARAGTIEALDADYTRTAILKGLPQRTVIRRHVLRNSLLPTIAVVATQAGYLIGGLVIIEVIFNYNGIGQTLARAATQKDIPVLQSGVLLVGIVYLVATLIADILYSVLNPRVRLGAAE